MKTFADTYCLVHLCCVAVLTCIWLTVFSRERRFLQFALTEIVILTVCLREESVPVRQILFRSPIHYVS
jgi:hypothetical protein